MAGAGRRRKMNCGKWKLMPGNRMCCGGGKEWPMAISSMSITPVTSIKETAFTRHIKIVNDAVQTNAHAVFIFILSAPSANFY